MAEDKTEGQSKRQIEREQRRGAALRANLLKRKKKSTATDQLFDQLEQKD